MDKNPARSEELDGTDKVGTVVTCLKQDRHSGRQAGRGARAGKRLFAFRERQTPSTEENMRLKGAGTLQR